MLAPSPSSLYLRRLEGTFARIAIHQLATHHITLCSIVYRIFCVYFCSIGWFYCIFAPFYHHYNPIVFLSFQQKSTCSIGNQTTALSLMKAPVSFINGLEKTNILSPHSACRGNIPPLAHPALATIECCWVADNLNCSDRKLTLRKIFLVYVLEYLNVGLVQAQVTFRHKYVCITPFISGGIFGV